MRKSFTYLLLAAGFGSTLLLSQSKVPPPKIVIPAKNGEVVFDHAAHLKRVKDGCKTCHPTLFAQDAKKPVGFRPPHRNEEDKQVSCGACHRPGGTAFDTKGNCTNGKCHVKPGTTKR